MFGSWSNDVSLQVIHPSFHSLHLSASITLCVRNTHLPLRVSRCVCFCVRECLKRRFKSSTGSPDEFHIIKLMSSAAKRSRDHTNPQISNSKQMHIKHFVLKRTKHKCLPNIHKKGFFLPTHSLSPTLITTSQGLISFSNLMT